MQKKILLKRKKLIDFRKSLNMTQAEFAKKANISRTTYQSWENGLNNPTGHSFIALCQILGANPKEFVENPKALPQNSLLNLKNVIDNLKENDRNIPEPIIRLINFWFTLPVDKQLDIEKRLDDFVQQIIYKLDDKL